MEDPFLLVGIFLTYQQDCVKYALLPPSWDQPPSGDLGRMLEMSCTLAGSDGRWVGTLEEPREAKSREKLGAAYPWVSASVSLHRARHILLMIHGAGTLWVTKQELLRDLGGVWKLPWCCFSSWCGMLAEDASTLSYPWHPGNADRSFSCQSCWYLTLLGCLWLWPGISFPFDFSSLFLAIHFSDVRQKVITETGGDLVMLIFQNLSNEI